MGLSVGDSVGASGDVHHRLVIGEVFLTGRMFNTFPVLKRDQFVHFPFAGTGRPDQSVT